MTLAFPNPSRSLDKARNAVRFTGYDGMFEVAFLVDVGALVNPATQLFVSEASETACLSAFDARRSSIYAAASKAYSNGHRAPYILTAADIR
ncbi:hypothetical protein J2X65_004131 [Ancylobacter sp. 3268]|uniref:DUF1488 family protein n=1 Tax=Ancylobacter sp. 3268 TaxID=2817752 RepID=UPI00285CB28F|nr:DUF1488 family protein [Ancylobacter sp. 3268]MDR6954755.1 hypothetical protein [Ancylobacter sp. 3268]